MNAPKNGIKVLVVENHKLPRVAYRLRIDNRPIIEGEKAGVTSLLGSILGNGTSTIPKDEFNEGRQKMAKMPAASELILNSLTVCPGFRIKNVFVFPGVPEIMKTTS